MALALLLMLSTIPLPETVSVERAARVADSYQPQAPTVRMAYKPRCVTTTDSNGNPTDYRCGL